MAAPLQHAACLPTSRQQAYDYTHTWELSTIPDCANLLKPGCSQEATTALLTFHSPEWSEVFLSHNLAQGHFLPWCQAQRAALWARQHMSGKNIYLLNIELQALPLLTNPLYLNDWTFSYFGEFPMLVLPALWLSVPQGIGYSRCPINWASIKTWHCTNTSKGKLKQIALFLFQYLWHKKKVERQHFAYSQNWTLTKCAMVYSSFAM